MSEKTLEEDSENAKKEETGEDDVATEKSNGDVNKVSKKYYSKVYKTNNLLTAVSDMRSPS